MQAIHKKRLLKLANYLDNVPKKNFNLNSIVNSFLDELNVENIDNESDVVCAAVKEGFCGTTACAIGHLPLVFPKNFEYIIDDGVQVVDPLSNDRDLDICEEFFGLNWNQIYYLFMPDYYPKNKRGSKSVAARIRKFVESNGKHYSHRYDL